MKNFYFYLIILAGLSFGIVSCAKDDSSGSPNTIEGTQSPIGDEGTRFSVAGLPMGISNASAVVTNLSEDGISTLTVSADITNTEILGMLSSIDGYSESINEISANFRITDHGAESVYDDGSCILVKFDAKVGDVYTGEHDGMTIRREVVTVSKDDDYYWQGMLLKTIKVKETGRNIPGLLNVEHVYNHRFGLVGVSVNFEDGSSKQIYVVSSIFN